MMNLNFLTAPLLNWMLLALCLSGILQKIEPHQFFFVFEFLTLDETVTGGAETFLGMP